MHSFRTHYQNLQVTENASPEVIRGAYRFLSQKWHPDKNPDNREEAERISKIINEGYAVLSDPERRREHDAWIAEQRAQAEAEQTARDPEDSSADDQDAGDSAEAQAAAAHRAALRATYAEGAAKSGRIGAFAWALLGSLFLMGLALKIDGIDAWADRHPWIGFLPLLIGFMAASDHVSKRRARLLAEHDDRMLEVLYHDYLRKKTVRQIVGGVALLLVVAGGGLFVLLDRQKAAPAAPDAQAAGPPPAPVAAPPRAAVPAPAAAPKPVAAGGGALYFVNRCHEPVRLAITYRQTSGEWSTEAWWEFKPQEQALLANDGEKLRSNHRIFYYYAEIPDAEYRWAGSEDNSNDRTRIVGERPYRFRQAELERNDNGDFTLALNCPNLS